mmetsp:Transcript_147571/g.472023  ORF Transcript_147571/g.472023 Transcript_147571/m.472023 type:complete len:220 (+) Transcript_147571:169-828(+)
MERRCRIELMAANTAAPPIDGEEVMRSSAMLTPLAVLSWHCACEDMQRPMVEARRGGSPWAQWNCMNSVYNILRVGTLSGGPLAPVDAMRSAGGCPPHCVQDTRRHLLVGHRVFQRLLPGQSCSPAALHEARHHAHDRPHVAGDAGANLHGVRDGLHEAIHETRVVGAAGGARGGCVGGQGEQHAGRGLGHSLAELALQGLEEGARLRGDATQGVAHDG